MPRFPVFLFVLFGVVPLAAIVAQADDHDTGTALDETPRSVHGSTALSVHTLRPKHCPCKCTSRRNARRQCRRFFKFCGLSRCNRYPGFAGERCCQKSAGGFGRCECLSGRTTLAVSFRSELRARVVAADLCAVKKSCPPDCNCGGCVVFNTLCISFKAPGGNRGWACSSDCRGGVTGCRRIPWKR